MVADPSPSIDATDASVASCVRAAIVDCSDECLALIASIADGKRHRLATLALQVAPRNEGGASVVRIVEALEAFRRAGMLMACDADSVCAQPFAPLSAGALAVCAPGWQVRLAGSTRSTNDDLMRAIRAQASLAAPRLIASEVQLAGRGRLGRRWVSTPGASLSVSFALRLARGLSQIDGITLVCGLAVRDVVVAHGVDARLKWPNDVLFDGRKLAGILVEAHATASGTAIVVGIGLNVTARGPIETSAGGLTPTDLQSCGGRSFDRNRIVGELASALQTRLQLFADQGFAAFVDEWNGADALIDRPMTLTRSTTDRVHGIARGVDAGGALTLEIDGVPTHVISGDVSVRPTDR